MRMLQYLPCICSRFRNEFTEFKLACDNHAELKVLEKIEGKKVKFIQISCANIA